ncbi:MAG: RNA polymerase sporulation sigma factor SigK [Oscillospiraceae bacterium]|nr:RNA polymerase sporulation sigma factor SigK [Oscillospiraceae bacterium]
MIENAIMLLFNSFLFMLRLSSGDSFPKPLSPEEEQRCLEQWEHGDIAARNKLVEHNLRLVAHIMKKYYAQTDDVDDLISIGTIGLIKGINSYRADKGVRLATYASRCIENEILMYFRSQKKSAGDMSLGEALDVDSDGNGLSVMDVVASDDNMAERIGDEEICAGLCQCVDSVLSRREALIIRLRYGLDGAKPRTQRETAEECGISRSYVSRIEKKALEKLRAALGEDAKPSYF